MKAEREARARERAAAHAAEAERASKAYKPPTDLTEHHRRVEWPIIEAALKTIRNTGSAGTEQRFMQWTRNPQSEQPHQPPLWLWGDALIYDTETKGISAWSHEETENAWHGYLERDDAKPADPVTVFVITSREVERRKAVMQTMGHLSPRMINSETDHVTAVYWPEGRVVGRLTVDGSDSDRNQPRASETIWVLWHMQDLIISLPRWGHSEDEDWAHNPQIPTKRVGPCWN